MGPKTVGHPINLAHGESRQVREAEGKTHALEAIGHGAGREMLPLIGHAADRALPDFALGRPDGVAELLRAVEEAQPKSVGVYFGSQPFQLVRIAAHEESHQPTDAAQVIGTTRAPNGDVDVFFQSSDASYAITLGAAEAESLGFTTNGYLNAIDRQNAFRFIVTSAAVAGGQRVFQPAAPASTTPHALDPIGLPILLKIVPYKHVNPYLTHWVVQSINRNDADPTRPIVLHCRDYNDFSEPPSLQTLRLDENSMKAFGIPFEIDPKNKLILRATRDTSTFPVERSPYVDESKRLEGAAWNRIFQNFENMISAASFRGFYADAAKGNEDRLLIGNGYYVVFDGLGGHGNGEMAAETARLGLKEALAQGHDMKEAITLAEHALHREIILKSGGNAGTTLTAVRQTAPDELTIHKIGDSDVMVFGFDEGDINSLSAEFWTDQAYSPEKNGPDGRALPEWIPSISLNPASNAVSDYLGKSARTETPVSEWKVPLMPGRRYFTFVMTDGFREQFVTPEEMAGIIRQSGAQDVADAQTALIKTALLRSKLAALQQEYGKPLKITPEVMRLAHTAMYDEISKDPNKPIPQPSADLLNVQHEMYVVEYQGGQYIAAPEAIDWSKGTLAVEPTTAWPHLVYGRVKVDNITAIGVEIIPEL